MVALLLMWSMAGLELAGSWSLRTGRPRTAIGFLVLAPVASLAAVVLLLVLHDDPATVAWCLVITGMIGWANVVLVRVTRARLRLRRDRQCDDSAARNSSRFLADTDTDSSK